MPHQVMLELALKKHRVHLGRGNRRGSSVGALNQMLSWAPSCHYLPRVLLSLHQCSSPEDRQFLLTFPDLRGVLTCESGYSHLCSLAPVDNQILI